MKAIRKNLISGETIIAQAHITNLMLLPSITVSAVCCAFGLAIKPWPLFPIALLASGCGILWKWIVMRSFILTITDRRLIGQTGLLRLNQMECSLDRIDAVTAVRDVPGMLFGYGDVTIKTTTCDYHYRNIAHIDTFKRMAMAASQNYKDALLKGRI